MSRKLSFDVKSLIVNPDDIARVGYRSAFIYGLLEPSENEIRYIGKSHSVVERFRRHLKTIVDTPCGAWIGELHARGQYPRLVVLCRMAMTDHGWCGTFDASIIAMEKWFIREYSTNSGRRIYGGNLLNVSAHAREGEWLRMRRQQKRTAHCGVEQLAAREAHNLEVVGANPTPTTLAE